MLTNIHELSECEAANFSNITSQLPNTDKLNHLKILYLLKNEI